MSDDHVFTTTDGERFPYFKDGCLYRISVIWDGHDSELNVSPSGADLSFDDGSSLLIPVAPQLLPSKECPLSNESFSDLVSFLSFVLNERPDLVTRFTQDDMTLVYQQYVRNKETDAPPPSRGA